MKQFDSALPGGDSLFRGLLESAPDAMVIVDRSGTIVLIGEDVKIVLNLRHESAVVKADRGQIEQVVMNRRSTHGTRCRKEAH
jgi:transcriptional regulator with PAS, ATPase and Fis domain